MPKLKDADVKLLQAVADALKSKIKGPIFLAGAANGRVALLAIVPKELTAKLQANKLIQEIAPIVGGKGGGAARECAGFRSGGGQDRQGLGGGETLAQLSWQRERDKEGRGQRDAKHD